MKKCIVVIFLFVVFYGEFDYVNMDKYGATTKHVEVKGEVEKPGVYEVDRHATTGEILKLAGGAKQGSDTSTLNLTKDVENHSVIVVGKKEGQKKVSINSATQEELTTLPGIGPAVAQRIIAYRQQHAFRSLTEIMEVKGIGDKLYAKIVEQITL